MRKKSIIGAAIIVVLVMAIVFAFFGCSDRLEETDEPSIKIPSAEEEALDEIDSGEEEKEEPSGQDERKDTEPESGIIDGRVYYAILKSINPNDNTITVKQLESEPYEAEIGDVLKLDSGYTVERIVVIRDEEEKEYSKDINLEEVALNTEIGVIFKEGFVQTIIYSFMLDTLASPDVEELKPLEGEYMVAAKLIDANTASEAIIVEQLINEPNEKIIDPEVKLADECKVYKSILIRSDESEREYTAEISINEIPLNTEIGIGFKKDNLARMIISQEWFEE